MFYDKQEDIDDLVLWSDRHGKPAVGGSDEQEIPVGDLPKALQNLYREVEPLMFEDTGILLAEFKHRYGAVIEYCTDILAEFDNASLFADEFLKMECGMAKEAHDLHCTVSARALAPECDFVFHVEVDHGRLLLWQYFFVPIPVSIRDLLMMEGWMASLYKDMYTKKYWNLKVGCDE